MYYFKNLCFTSVHKKFRTVFLKKDYSFNSYVNVCSLFQVVLIRLDDEELRFIYYIYIPVCPSVIWKAKVSFAIFTVAEK